MRKFIFLLWVMPLLFASCSDDKEVANEETIQVSFSTQLPQRIGTRASSSLNVNKVVCAVFEKGEEIGNLRQVVDITESGTVEFAPRLIKGHTYDIVFWAMKDGCYDVTDMKAIKRASMVSATEPDFEAFTQSVEVEVTGAKSETVKLNRPYAQLNLGVTADDWNAVANTFNMVPKKMVIKMTGKDTFNALTGKATGEDAEITRTLEVSGSDLTVGENTYKSIASCYVYPEEGQQNVDITYSIYTEDNEPIRENVSITNVPLQENYLSNIVGGLLTGTITYTITIEKGYGTDNNTTI